MLAAAGNQDCLDVLQTSGELVCCARRHVHLCPGAATDL